MGGDEDRALPAAAAVEIYHTWTLVHDDIIDRDRKRRGGLTVHTEFCEKAQAEMGYDLEEARHYGITIAILTGDAQIGWSFALLGELFDKCDVDPALVIYLLRELSLRVQTALIAGEALDVQFAKYPLEQLTQEMVLDMLWKKTGILYEFAGKAGALIGLGRYAPDHRNVKALSSFTGLCGLAFQLQDDILGVVGQEDVLGKPVGSDIREGKKTTIVLFALNRATPAQRQRLLQILGNRDAGQEDIEEARALLVDLGAIEFTKRLAQSYVQQALKHLNPLPPSRYKELLLTWANFMIEREF